MKVKEIDVISAYATLKTASTETADPTATPDKPPKRRKTEVKQDSHRQLDEKLYKSLVNKKVTEVARTDWQDQKWERFKAGRNVD